jgi:polyphosphate kinase
VDLNQPELFFNRELSHLEFNYRVLQQALDESHPLLERLNFLCIFSSNLDEFFEVRVANLKQQLAFGREKAGPDGQYPQLTLDKIYETVSKYVELQYDILNNQLQPEMAQNNVRFWRRNEWNDDISRWVKRYFKEKIQPVISPLGLDPAHPFPRLVNKSLNFIVELEGKDAFGRDTGLAIIPAPRSLPRIIRMPNEIIGSGDHFVFLSSMIHQHADELFPGMKTKSCYQFRVTRNTDLSFDEEDVADWASALKTELHARHFGEEVRLEVSDNCPSYLEEFLLGQFNLTSKDLYRVKGPVNIHRLMSVRSLCERPDLYYPPFTPGLPNALNYNNNIFDGISHKDQLLLHPFESFTPVIDLLRQAAKDPNVLAIKQTLYRTGSQSKIIDALVEAARSGKEVTVVIELRARFDEEENLKLANRLQEAGCVIVYGVVGYKTHAKMMLIVRRENGALRRYCHLGTGNYHANNARLYTDYSFLTANQDICEDVHKVFQQLTGMGKALRIKKLFHAPFTLHSSLINLIEREIEHKKAGHEAKIIIKVNSLTEPEIIRALYRASQAGVNIKLLIRGMCRLRPGIPGISDNIHVRSIIGRFLEHTRVYYFLNGKEEQVYAASADWMERNLLNRVETCFPIEGKKLINRVREELLLYLADNCQSWVLQPDGRYIKNEPEADQEIISAQRTLLDRLSQ